MTPAERLENLEKAVILLLDSKVAITNDYQSQLRSLVKKKKSQIRSERNPCFYLIYLTFIFAWFWIAYFCLQPCENTQRPI